jgi:flagellar FliJ protein
MAIADKKFKLEQVLIYRREMEKLRKQEHAAAKEGLEKANQDLMREENLVELLTQEFRLCQKDIGCVDDIRMYSDYFALKREVIKLQKVRVEHLDHITNEKRSELIEASRDKKVLESLKEKKAAEFRQEMATKERNFLDENSIQKKVEPT